ncbi:MAG: glutamate--cysteine ligase [Bacteriovoracaceae bacterium]|nr:glutamate--cysteine ligase [Bacteriovoracaceae bacterium]
MKDLLNKIDNFKVSSSLRRGIEKESLRVTKEGVISQKPHPMALGSALTHPSITTDYSEALLEFVTPVYSDPVEMLKFLEDLHVYTLQQMDEEILWANSMPCLLEKETKIPIANYGSSNVGKMKSVYRRGLLHRYGSAMQVISGIHFNFSLSDDFFLLLHDIEESTQSIQDFKSKMYMNAARNIHRHSWLIPFVFGSSPAICQSFLNKTRGEFSLKKFDDKGTMYFDGSTSLRLSNLGYTNSEQGKIKICYNDINSYATGLREAILTPEKRYEDIGIKVDGEYKQLNSNILQIENEYYSGVRPKRVALSGESPTNALLRGGVEYLELRSVDVNAFSPIGIEIEQVYFLDVFLLYCLLDKNELLTLEMNKRFRSNQELVARHGRQKNLNLFNGSEDVPARELAKEVFDNLFQIASKLDNELGEKYYTNSVQHFYDSIDDSSKLYSERILNEMKETGMCFFSTTMARSHDYSKRLKGKSLSEQVKVDLDQASASSHLKQKEIEDSDVLKFDQFLEEYFKQNSRP